MSYFALIGRFGWRNQLVNVYNYRNFEHVSCAFLKIAFVSRTNQSKSKKSTPTGSRDSGTLSVHASESGPEDSDFGENLRPVLLARFGGRTKNLSSPN